MKMPPQGEQELQFIGNRLLHQGPSSRPGQERDAAAAAAAGEGDRERKGQEGHLIPRPPLPLAPPVIPIVRVLRTDLTVVSPRPTRPPLPDEPPSKLRPQPHPPSINTRSQTAAAQVRALSSPSLPPSLPTHPPPSPSPKQSPNMSPSSSSSFFHSLATSSPRPSLSSQIILTNHTVLCFHFIC